MTAGRTAAAGRKLPVMTPDYETLAKLIDHAILVPTTPPADLEAGVRMAAAYQVASTCVVPYCVRRSAEILEGSGVSAGTVIGFPHGTTSTTAKVAESRQAMHDGAVELDMVINQSAAAGGDWKLVADDIRAAVAAGHDGGALVKVIFETCNLDDDQKRRLCDICVDAGADWVKTSTGFAGGGATDGDLKLMLEAVDGRCQVKASGGIRTYERLLEVHALGCTRAGASATQAILDEARRRLGLEPIYATANAQETTY